VTPDFFMDSIPFPSSRTRSRLDSDRVLIVPEFALFACTLRSDQRERGNQNRSEARIGLRAIS
jgi:hypothetical protein